MKSRSYPSPEVTGFALRDSRIKATVSRLKPRSQNGSSGSNSGDCPSGKQPSTNRPAEQIRRNTRCELDSLGKRRQLFIGQLEIRPAVTLWYQRCDRSLNAQRIKLDAPSPLGSGPCIGSVLLRASKSPSAHQVPLGPGHEVRIRGQGQLFLQSGKLRRSAQRKMDHSRYASNQRGSNSLADLAA